MDQQLVPHIQEGSGGTGELFYQVGNAAGAPKNLIKQQAD
jgi:hypothetical protein